MMGARAGDTIAAVSTAPGEAGIGVVRLSGPRALACARVLFRRTPPLPEPPRPRHAYFGEVVDPAGSNRLDDCLLTWFPAPHSYTGEEVVELSCHGSPVVLRALLRGLLATGARLAEPGEFTRRAFLNGRMDLAAAEAVADVIRARTDAALRVATGQLGGRLSREVSALRGALIELLASIEAAIDFPDDVEPPPDAEVASRAAAVEARCLELVRSAGAGRLYREGAALVLAGRPNTGKSSLLNAFLGEERAIVTPVPGTTRDTIEESLDLRGIPVRAVDTAGIRASDDPVEQLGVARARTRVAAADLVLWVLEAPSGITAEDAALAPLLAGAPRLVAAANKVDQGDSFDDAALAAATGRPVPVVRLSALTGAGMPALEEALARELGAGVSPESIWVSNVRHEERLRAAAASLRRAREAAGAGFHQAAIALDLRQAAEALGDVTGETVTEETISTIFARFCVGK